MNAHIDDRFAKIAVLKNKDAEKGR